MPTIPEYDPSTTNVYIGHSDGTQEVVNQVPTGDALPLGIGSSGENVRKMQTAMGLAVTGTFDAATLFAVQQFQMQHHLLATGVVDARTWSALFPAAAPVPDPTPPPVEPKPPVRTRVIDCASNASKHMGALHKNGIGIVIRYFGTVFSFKNAGKAEIAALRKSGFGVVCVFETTADMMLGSNPKAAGIKGAKAAQAGILRAGAPKDAFVYFACDRGTQAHSKVAAYLDGAASVLGKNRVGIYGSYDVCATALKGNHAHRAWQTLAWSNGKRLASASLYQSDNHSTKYGDLGMAYDVDLMLKSDVGQWI